VLKTGISAGPLRAARERLRFLRKDPKLLIVWPLAALIFAGIGWAALLAKLDTDRREIEAFALHEVAALSRGYADHLSRTLEAIDQILLHVKYEWQLTNGNLRLETLKQEGLFPPSSVFNVGIVGRDGKLVTSTFRSTAGDESSPTFEGREFFLAQRNSPKDFLYIGGPALAPASQRTMIQLSRRLVDRHGDFSGVVAVSVVPDYFTAVYDNMTLGANGLLGVIGNDRLIRATRTGQTIHPPNSQAFVSVPPFTPQSESVLLNGNNWFTDKRSRYVGWQAVKGYPLVALTGLDAHDMLAPYQSTRGDLIREARWATAVLVAFMVIAMTQSIRLGWRKYQLEQTQVTYRMATEGGNEGFYIVRPIRNKEGTIVDFEIVDSNYRGAKFLGQRREAVVGSKISSLYTEAAFERPMTRLRQAMEVGFYEDDVEVPSDSPLRAQWVHVRIVRSNGDLGVTLRDISDTKAYVEELERRSNEDALTGLPNRNWVQTYLPQAIGLAAANGAKLALLFVDLDDFKAVNDAMGHPAGDELLRNAARRLRVAVRPQDKVVRLGGDEFVIILDKIAHERDAAHVAERILQAFQESFTLSQGVHSVSTSIGISVFPTDGTDADTLLRNADIAMYAVKTTAGKRNFGFYDQKFYDALRARREQEAELRYAIAHDQFLMYYQPRVDISTGATCSMEALVRWVHPSRGLLEPLEFIPLAEETGLILPLGELVIDKVCAQLAHWARTNEELVPVSINVSPRQFNQADIAQSLSTSLARHHIPARLVELELTESTMMGGSADIYRSLDALRGMGIKLLVDDFGTGYSSLSQLQRLDFDVLKVDQAFTAEIDRTKNGNVFFKAIITMAHALGMRVVAEGVENEKQIRILKSLHCDEIQGFYISQPLPPSETQPILPKWFLPSIV
jgi:diguanylate cyclase (GGDEF)-like protein